MVQDTLFACPATLNTSVAYRFVLIVEKGRPYSYSVLFYNAMCCCYCIPSPSVVPLQQGPSPASKVVLHRAVLAVRENDARKEERALPVEHGHPGCTRG